MAAEAMDLEKTVTKCSVKKLRFFEHDIIWPVFLCAARDVCKEKKNY